MIGVFMYYVKPPSNIEYFCKKATSKILSEDDEVIVRNRHIYYMHHIDGDDIDKMGDEELMRKIDFFMVENGYMKLFDDDVLSLVPNVETVYKEVNTVNVFDCLFTDLVTIS